MWKLKEIGRNSQNSELGLAFEKQAKDSLKKLRSRADLGFLKLPQNLDLVQSRAEQIISQTPESKILGKKKTLIVLGVGGSALGARAILAAFEKPNPKMDLVVIDNVDSNSFFKLIDQLDLNSCHWLLISKSGSTIDTLTQAEVVDAILKVKTQKSLSQVCTVITELKKNPLSDWAQNEGVQILELPEDVGGRYSVFSTVGLLPAACYGLNLQEIKNGIEWAKVQDDLINELCVQTLMSFQNQEWISLFWSYCDRLHILGYWWQQLWAESLAKKFDRDGKKAPRVSTPMIAVGSTDQHSILQQVMEGERDKFIFFLRSRDSESKFHPIQKTLFKGQEFMLGKSLGELFSAQADGTRDALREVGIASVTLETEQINEASFAALMMIFQILVASLGETLNVNAFDQPGVEAGKKVTRQILSKV